MSYSQRRDERRANIEQLMRWIEVNQPATLARVVSEGFMSWADAANALQYGIATALLNGMSRWVGGLVAHTGTG